MTTGHKHRHVIVPSLDVWYVRLLRTPLIVLSDRHTECVDRSPYPYGVRVSQRDHHDEFYLTLLGILHRWTGLTLEVKDGEGS